MSLDAAPGGLRAPKVGTCRGLSGILNAAEPLRPN